MKINCKALRKNLVERMASSPPPVKYVIFDLDGLLLDTGELKCTTLLCSCHITLHPRGVLLSLVLISDQNQSPELTLAYTSVQYCNLHCGLQCRLCTAILCTHPNLSDSDYEGTVFESGLVTRNSVL